MCCKLHAHIKFFGFIFQDRVSLAILEPRLTYLCFPDAGIKDVRHHTWQRLFSLVLIMCMEETGNGHWSADALGG